MRIAIVAPSPIPFSPGGAEAVWSGLYRELTQNWRHDVELVKIPILENSLPAVMSAYESFSRLDLHHFDMVISGKYPAWMVSHPHHVLYMLHPLRGLYDTYAAFGLPVVETSQEPGIRRLLDAAEELRTSGDLTGLFQVWRSATAELGAGHPAFAFPGPLSRTLIQAMDSHAMRPGAISRHLAISATVAGRAGYFANGVRPEVIYPPSDLQGLHTGHGEFFFTTSRHDAPKRLELLIRAMAFYRGSRDLVIGGNGPETEALEAMAAADRRIRFVGRLSPADLVDHYAAAIGVPFIPVDEDLGLITIEAMSAGKPVLTTHDAGGPTEFVLSGRSGFIVDPTPEAIGFGLSRLENLASSPGTTAAAKRAVAGISWNRLAGELVSQRPRLTRASDRGRRPRLVVTSTFPIWPPRGGGQLRAYHLYGELAQRFDIDLVCLAYPSVPASVTQLKDGMTEYVVPRSADHQAAEAEISAKVGFPVTDIVDGRLSVRTPEYTVLLGHLLQGAQAVILADPFLHPAISRIGSRLPIIYDAYNCEYVLKSQILPHTAAGDELRHEVEQVEGAACREAELIMTVSPEDQVSLMDRFGAPDRKFLLIPNGVDLREVPFTPMPQRALNRERWLARWRAGGRGSGLTALATFIGSWHPPNNAAGAAIVDMAPELPEVGFLLMGGHCATLENRKLPPNVFTLGMVSDSLKQRVLRTADVALAPLVSGSGTNLKVVEYLAAGLPLISTAVGLRGLSLDPGLIRPTEVAAFPGAIRTELQAAHEAGPRTERARTQIENSYGWDALGQRATTSIQAALSRISAAG